MKNKRIHLYTPLWAIGSILALLLASCQPLVTAPEKSPPPQTAPSVAPDDWPTYMRSIVRSGFNAAETSITATTVSNLKLHWIDQGSSRVFSQPIVAHNLIFWGSGDGYEHATDLQGHPVWAANLGWSSSVCPGNGDDKNGVLNTPTVASVRIHGKQTEVLFVASIYKPTPWGIAAYIDNLVRGLIGQGCRVKVVALVEPHEKEAREFLDTYEDWVIPLEVSYDQRPKSWLGSRCISLLEILRCTSPRAKRLLDKTRWFKASSYSVAQLEKVLEMEKPAVVVFGHIYHRFYPFVLHLKETQREYGIIAHDYEFHYSKNRINDRIVRGKMIRSAKWIAANSSSTKSLVEAWDVARENIVIVHPALPDHAMKLSHELPSDGHNRPYTLITVSRIVQSKGIDIVLRALRILDQAQVPFRYVIAGQGPDRAAFEKLSIELGLREKVWFAGFVSEEEKWRLLQSADVYVMPSRIDLTEAHEGFGIAFLEAAACGLPGIGSNAGGMTDAVVDGKTGLLVDPDSAKQLTDALMFLYLNAEKRREMGKAARQRARSQFSPQVIATHFQNEISLRSTIWAERALPALTLQQVQGFWSE